MYLVSCTNTHHDVTDMVNHGMEKSWIFLRNKKVLNQCLRWRILRNCRFVAEVTFKSCMRYQVDFLIPLKLQKISYYFGLCRQILLTNKFAGFFTFDLYDLLIVIPGVHCNIVLVQRFSENIHQFISSFFRFSKHLFLQSASIRYLTRKIFIQDNFENA